MGSKSKKKRQTLSGELEVSGYFYTGWGGEGEEGVTEKKTAGWLAWLTVFLLSAFFLRVSYLQIWKGNYYQAQAETNRVKSILINAPRGIVYDREHKVLASNSPQFNLVMVPALVPKDDLKRGKLFNKVTVLTEISQEELEKKYQEVFPDSFDFLLLMEDIAREKALEIEVEVIGWEGILLESRAKRNYPFRESGSHILGYTGKINKEELKDHPDYSLNDTIGKEGVEAVHESHLRGVKGKRQLEVDSFGKVTRVVGASLPEMGDSIVLSVDADLQNAAYESLKQTVEEGEGVGGAVIAIDPRDGGILALASYPSFDNNKFVGKISSQDLNDMLNGEERVLFNRAIGGTYPPGSTFKPLVAAAALDENIINPGEILSCPEVISIGQWEFKDWKYHGPSDLNKAIAESVNPYFYIIGGGWADKSGLGVEKIGDYALNCGLGKKLGIDIPQEAKGLVPGPEWKEEVKKERWYIGDTYHLAIGQGDILVTPLQLASYISALINGGTLYRPQLLDYVENYKGEIVKKNSSQIIGKNLFSKSSCEAVKNAMKATVFSKKGSGRRLRSITDKYGVDMGGKTGTAQYGEEEKYHAWFVGFTPVENSEIVVAVLIEKGGEGHSTALPVAEKVFDKFLEKRN